MNTYELLQLATWLKQNLGQALKRYQTLGQVLEHNARQPQKQPLEGPLEQLTSFLRGMDLAVLSSAQIRLLSEFGAKKYLGLEGVDFLDRTIRKSDFDPATAHSDVEKAIQQLQQTDERADAILGALQDLTSDLAEPEIGEGRVLIRIEFLHDAAIKDVSTWKSWSATWYEIVRGIALAVEETPEETRVVGASQGSVIMKLAATYAFTRVLALISKSIASIVKDHLDILHSIEDLKAKKLLNKASETALEKNVEELKENGVARVIEEVQQALPNSIAGDAMNALEKSIKKALEFRNKGGEVDFVSPQESDEGREDDDATQELIRDVRRVIEEARRKEEAVKLLTHLTDEDED